MVPDYLRTLLLSFIAMLMMSDKTFASQTDSPIQNRILQAQFTSTPAIVDGIADAEWNTATPSPISNSYNNDLSGPAPASCTASGEVRAMWDGAVLYILVSVNDVPATNKDSVEFWIDHFNDKTSKFEEDDGMMTLSAPPATMSANRPQNVIYDNVTSRYLKSYASAYKTGSAGKITGYNVEIAWYLGEHARRNGSTFGFDFGIDKTDASGAHPCRVFWNPVTHGRSTDSNVEWGTIVLAGYDGHSPMQLDTFMLSRNIEKAKAVVRGIWTNEDQLDKALAHAMIAIGATSQNEIDHANRKLDSALRGLRRNGPFPDPYDLPVVNHLNDPFAFLDGRRVKSLSDWNNRRNEIKTLAQYYEYGIKPPKPEKLTATSVINNQSRDITINMNDNHHEASFTTRLTLPTAEQAALSGKSAPFPVIVSLDYKINSGNNIYLDAGYAVLSIPTYDVQSDNVAHTGAIFDLYPYDVAAGHDFGCL
ncbi:MAG: sugar-binding protein, partial [Steroidobacter sp.]